MRTKAGVTTLLMNLLMGCAAPANSGLPSMSATSRPPAPATLAEVASPSTTPLVSAPRMTWSEVPFDGDIADVMGDGGRFVAVGRGRLGASAWSSTDGSVWEEHDVPQQSFGELPDGSELGAGMGTLVRLGDTLYSFGATARFNDASRGAGWRWTDGRSWEAIESASAFFAGEVIAAIASDQALLASTVAFGGGPRGTLETWRWTSATSWVRTSLPSDILVSAFARAEGTFLAAGSGPSLWTSSDGLDWTSAALPVGLSEVCALTSTAAGGFLTFGKAGDRIAAWTSADGNDWVESSLQPADVSGMADDSNLPAACSVAAADSGLVAAMLVGNDALVWTSRDGLTWEFKETLEVGSSFGPVGHRVLLAALGDHVLLAGSLTDPADPNALRQRLLVGVMEP